MSNAFPTGAPLWLMPHIIYVVTGSTRDVYGKVTLTTTKETRGRVFERPIELIEAGTRVTRSGATIDVLFREGFTIGVGTVIRYGSDEYTVIGYTDRPDHLGDRFFWRCDCVKKAQDQA